MLAAMVKIYCKPKRLSLITGGVFALFATLECDCIHDIR